MIEKLILGTVQMGLPYGINNPNGQIGEAESFRILETAYKAGIRNLDSAGVYGNAHQIIGEFHKKNADHKFKVNTKIPKLTHSGNLRPKLLGYIEELNIENLEAAMFHSFEAFANNPDLKKILNEYKDEGFISQLGVSVYTNRELEEVIEDDFIDLVQLPFNLLDNQMVRGELLQSAKKRGKIIHSRSAFLQGLFFKDPQDNHPVVQQLVKPLNKIRTLSKKYNVPIAALALLYCLKQKFIDRVIIGVDSMKQLKMNLEFCEGDLPEEVMGELNCIDIKDRDLLNPSLWP